MIIYYTEDFKNALKEPSRRIKISKFKLGESVAISEIGNIKDYWNKGTSPTIGEYDLEGIYKDSTLTLSICIPSYDVSSSNDMDAYDIIYVLYEDLVWEGDLKLAFILSGNIVRDTEKNVLIFKPLFLEPQRSIITIKNFNPKCSLVLGQDNDLSFLEGVGLGKPRHLYTDEECVDDEDIRYVSRKSYETYLQEIRNQDEYSHLDTNYINKYGLKIY